MPDHETLERATDAWLWRRNQDGIRVNWGFTIQDARIKLNPYTYQFNSDALLGFLLRDVALTRAAVGGLMVGLLS